MTVVEQDRPSRLESTPATDTNGRSFRRLEPAEALMAQAQGALVVDIRRASTRREEGEIPGALVVAGPLREWRLGSDSPVRIVDTAHEQTVVVVGDLSQSSILVASALRGLGVSSATDVVGGFPAWRDAGLPVSDSFTLVGRRVGTAVGAPV